MKSAMLIKIPYYHIFGAIQMNPYLQPPGFLGTGASLLTDITLLAYILLIVPGMIAGFIFARRGQHRPHHKYTMIAITIVNWLLIIFLMLTAYRYDVVGNIGSQPTNARYLMPTIHAVLGLPAQLLATYVIYRMLREDSQVAAAKARGEKGPQLSKYWFKNAKPIMRLTLTLWLITALLGVFNYLIRYDILPNFGNNRGGVPAITAEPAATSEALTTAEPGTTAEPATTVEPGVTAEVMTTEEAATATRAPATTVEPGVTPEVTP
jgi:uncharacterized membrane protein YozB (DUF420 family)